ncbi:hypothetical protein ACLOJK_007712 [Asimina triloba]
MGVQICGSKSDADERRMIGAVEWGSWTLLVDGLLTIGRIGSLLVDGSDAGDGRMLQALADGPRCCWTPRQMLAVDLAMLLIGCDELRTLMAARGLDERRKLVLARAIWRCSWTADLALLGPLADDRDGWVQLHISTCC